MAKTVVVWGPPASGKSTHVREHRSKNSLTFDFDAVMQALSGLAPHRKNRGLIGLVLDVRDTVIEAIPSLRVDEAWIIVTWVDDELREALAHLDPEYVLMDVDEESCLARVDDDPDRAAVADEMKQVIKDWFTKFKAKGGGGMSGRESSNQLERRYIDADELEVREDPEGEGKIVGYAARFNSLSEPLWGFREKISPGAFAESIQTDDIRALWNHDSNYVLGRNRSGSLFLEEDEHGLRVEITPPDTQWARDLRESIKRRDVSQMSFGFIAESDDWDRSDKNNVIRTLTKVRCFDVSPVTFPAYPQTSVGVRSAKEIYEEHMAEEQEQLRLDTEKRQRELQIREREVTL